MEKVQKKLSLIFGITCIVLSALVMLSSIIFVFSQLDVDIIPIDIAEKTFIILSGPFYYGLGMHIPYVGGFFSAFLVVFLLVSGKRFLNSQNKPLSKGTCISSLVFGALFLVISFVGFGVFFSEDFDEEYGLVRFLSIIVFIFTTIAPVAMYVFNLVSGSKMNKVEEATAEVAATTENNGENN